MDTVTVNGMDTDTVNGMDTDTVNTMVTDTVNTDTVNLLILGDCANEKALIHRQIVEGSREGEEATQVLEDPFQATNTLYPNVCNRVVVVRVKIRLLGPSCSWLQRCAHPRQATGIPPMCGRSDV